MALPPTPRRCAAVLLLVALTGCAGADPERSPGDVGGPAGVQSFPDLSHEHVSAPVSYPQTPPVGGPHWQPQAAYGPGWLRCGAYAEPVVAEFAVHSLEHGAVWLSYRPGAAEADVQALTDLVAVDPAYVLVSPVPGQAAPFVATAWGLQLPVGSAQDPRLRAFTEAYAAGGQGGEKGADCAGGSTPEQARRALTEAG